MIREWLRRGNVSHEEAKQVTLVVTPPANGEQALRQGQVDVAGLSGVLRDRALERGGIRPLFTDRDLFGNFNATTYVMRKSFIAEHPDAARQFVASTARAIEWARKTQPDVVRARLRDILQRRNRGEDPSLAKFWHGGPPFGAVTIRRWASIGVAFRRSIRNFREQRSRHGACLRGCTDAPCNLRFCT
jgi:ABC-type nitrate/sulfonate/bicarbonate transport system substrate-binding protein